jgi:16S rRNA (cytidine1402-2'-O)-methyltransferase
LAGTLFVVSTPIGNLGDMTVRAVAVLREVDLILAEDTRHARTLLDRYEIHTPTTAFHEHNEARATVRALARLATGDGIALITDAGTPLLSDPGARLVRAAIAADVPVVPIPGPSALLAALVVAGLPTDQFTYFGFLPRHGAARTAALAQIAALPHTAVIYEAPGRVAATLADVAAHADAGNRPAAVARELTKRFEEIRRGTVADLAAYYEATPPRGEVVIIIGRGTAPAVDEAAVRERVHALRAAGVSRREIVAALAAEGGVSRNVAYRIAHEEIAGDPPPRGR